MKLFVTGASGFLGGELVPRLLEEGHTVYALARRPLKYQHPHLHEVPGDVTEDLLGADFSGPIDEMVHLAAVTSLSQKDADGTALVNVQGTINAFLFAVEHGAKRFHYASTLYIAGDHRGAFGEDDFYVGQHFKNPYERSKFRAELFLREQDLIPASFYRLGILVGSAKDGRASSFDSYYVPIRAIFAAHKVFERKLHFPERHKVEDALGIPRLVIPIRIYGDPESSLALAPVDEVAAMMARLMKGPGGTFHIVPATQVSNRTTAETICEALQIEGFHFGMKSRRNPLDGLYNRLIRDFTPYLETEPRFQTRTPLPAVDRDALLRILRYFRDQEPALRGYVEAL